MKKIALFFLLFSATLTLALAQSAHVTRLEFPKIGKLDAATITLNGEDKNVEAVIEDKVQRETGAKPKSYKGGYKVVTGVRHRTISHDNIDLYYKVEKGGTKETPQSQVFVVLSHGNESYLEEASFPDEFRAAKEMLEELPREVQMYELSLVIDEEQKNMEKAQKDYEKMGQDSVNLQVELTETQQAIEDNTVQREQQRLMLQEQGALLEDYKKRLEEVRGRKD